MSTDEIRLKGMVFSLPLKRLGTFRVTPCWSMMICEGKTRFPSVSRVAMNVSMAGEVMYALCLSVIHSELCKLGLNYRRMSYSPSP